ncbi:DUF1349 domain-containing protein [Flagellimonas sp.]|uniref:DUF1349 domain-containing protein n=1 Tax=Flagellimonas sp. TaxID=2058762 RepID=UPI003F4A1154
MKKTIYKIIFVAVLLAALTCCTEKEKQEKSSVTQKGFTQNNKLTTISKENLSDFQWLNKPLSFEVEDGVLKVVAEKGTDFFNNPEDKSKTLSAPLLFQAIEGDFIAKARVQPDFTSLWNAVALMVHIDNDNWIKFAFENSDATGRSIVSVVTKNLSDDANGVVLKDEDSIWLKIVRKDNIYSMLWSKNGKDFKMARLTTMKSADSVKIGIEFQSPVGDSAKHQVDYFEIEKTTVQDLRKGE